MTPRLIGVACFLAATSIMSISLGQSATVFGRVIEFQSGGIPGVTVEVAAETGENVGLGITNAEGHFEVSGLPLGEVLTLTFTRIGYELYPTRRRVVTESTRTSAPQVVLYKEENALRYAAFLVDELKAEVEQQGGGEAEQEFEVTATAAFQQLKELITVVPDAQIRPYLQDLQVLLSSSDYAELTTTRNPFAEDVDADDPFQAPIAPDLTLPDLEEPPSSTP